MTEAKMLRSPLKALLDKGGDRVTDGKGVSGKRKRKDPGPHLVACAFWHLSWWVTYRVSLPEKPRNGCGCNQRRMARVNGDRAAPVAEWPALSGMAHKYGGHPIAPESLFLKCHLRYLSVFISLVPVM
ncbi:hypothetical protein PUN4_360002 [Paraburkholderia unamae]|nr:hypothetical protein PUN4_360002 [Paraburkholderia unamae]